MQERFQTFTILISKISRNIRRIKNQEMAEYGLRSVHVTCLYYLYSSGALTATQLCERCEEDKATISRALDFLRENGFIVCEPKHQKPYNSPLYLTDRGSEAGKKITDKIRFVLDEICIDLTDEQRDDFYHSLAVISDNLELCTMGVRSAKKFKENSTEIRGN